MNLPMSSKTCQQIQRQYKCNNPNCTTYGLNQCNGTFNVIIVIRMYTQMLQGNKFSPLNGTKEQLNR